MVKVEIRNAQKLLRLLKELPQDVVSDRKGGVAAKAVRTGARPLFNEVRRNLQVSIDKDGGDSTGLLVKNLKLRRRKANFKGEHFTIGVGNKRYPKRNGETYVDKRGKVRNALMKGATTKLNGARLEYGTSRQSAVPWLRPALAAKAEQTIHAITGDLEKRLDKLAGKYLKGK